jgi:hypothetical protein
MDTVFHMGLKEENIGKEVVCIVDDVLLGCCTVYFV